VINSVTVLVVALFSFATPFFTTAAVEDGGLPEMNVYVVLAEPIVTVEVVVVNTVDVMAALGADSAEATMPLQAMTVLSFIFSIGVNRVAQRGKSIVGVEGRSNNSMVLMKWCFCSIYVVGPVLIS
jgi:hypothetical protein